MSNAVRQSVMSSVVRLVESSHRRAATHAGHQSCLTPSGSQSCHRSVGRSRVISSSHRSGGHSFRSSIMANAVRGSQSCHWSVGRSSHHTGRAATHAGHQSCLTPVRQPVMSSVDRSAGSPHRSGGTHSGHQSCLTPSGSQSCHRSVVRPGSSHRSGAATHADHHSCLI